MKYFNTDLPSRMLDMFELQSGVVHWIGARPGSASGNKIAPWGAPAGGQFVLGRGLIVSAAGARLLTCDVRYALENAGEWPWQHGTAVPFVGVDPRIAARGVELVRARWQLHNGLITWKQTRGDNAKEDETARGQAISGFRCNVITTGQIGFLYDDVKHLLTIGSWPWETGIDWD